MAFTPRFSQPTDFSTYYGSYNSWNRYSSYGNEGNCTWYAYGRTNEIAYLSNNVNIYSEFRITQSPGNGKDWIYNTWQQYTYTSGTIDLHLGDILVWGGGTYGHVEVVEAINGNLISTSYSISGANWSKSLFFGTRTIQKPTWGSYLGTVRYNDGTTGSLTNPFIGYIHNPYADGGGGGTEVPTITVTPGSYTVTMQPNETTVDFQFSITLTGVPSGYSPSGNNTFPNLVRVQNSGWGTGTEYYVDGVPYYMFSKTQTLRYTRIGTSEYTTTEHMYYDITYPNGSAYLDTPMRITVLAVNLRPIILSLAYFFIFMHRPRKLVIK